MIKGIDISKHNRVIDFEEVKKHVDFIIIRCGFGDDIKSQDDEQFVHNVKGCELAGIPYGVYFYSYALSIADTISEIKHVKRLLKETGNNFKCGFYLDMEDAPDSKGIKYKLSRGFDIYKDKQRTCDICNEFVKAFNCGIYASYYLLRDVILADDRLKNVDVWNAQWSNTNGYDSHCKIWQYTSDGHVDGINSRVDCNYGYFNLPASTPAQPITPKPTAPQVSVNYRVRTAQKGWLPEVKDFTDYAGVIGQAITDIAIRVNHGSIKYRVHTGEKWLPYVTGCNLNDSSNGYAGNGKPIDAIEVYYYTPNGEAVKRALYHVSPLNKSYYSEQVDNETANGMDGYAGCFGKSIDRIQIIIK